MIAHVLEVVGGVIAFAGVVFALVRPRGEAPPPDGVRERHFF